MILLSDKDNLDRGFVSPEIPNNFLTKGRFINNDLPRIQLYDNISDALSSRLGENLKGMVFYVYKPKYLKKDNLIVPDLNDIPYFLGLYGKEYWYLTDIHLEKIGKIEVKWKKEDMTYHYGPRQTAAKMYKWGWDEVLEPWEKSKLMKARKKLFSESEEKKRNKGIVLGSGVLTGAGIGLGTAKLLEKGLDEKKVNRMRDLIYKPAEKIKKTGKKKNPGVIIIGEGAEKKIPKRLVTKDSKEIIERVVQEEKKLGQFAKSKKGKAILTLGTAALAGGKILHDQKKKENKK